MDLLVLLIVIVVIIVVSYIGKWLWNNYLVPNVNIVSPLRSWIDFLMIAIVIILLFGCHPSQYVALQKNFFSGYQ